MLLNTFINDYIPPLTSNDYFISITVAILISCFTIILMQGVYSNTNQLVTRASSCMKFLYDVCRIPFLILLVFYAIYFSLTTLARYFPAIIDLQILANYSYVLTTGEFLIYFWLILNLLNIGKARLLNWLLQRKNTMVYNIISAIGSSLQAAILLMMLNILIPQLTLTGIPLAVLQNISKVLLVSLLGWIFIQIVDVVGKIIESQYVLSDNSTVDSRKINTQLVIIKRLIIAVAIVVTLASILRIFDSVRNIGTGILTTAGIISALGAFASQQSLSRIFAGLHIAFTQPIRIGDTVIIENEFGQVEEITLSYIVIKLWDLRRLILPTDYFTSKGLQNLTRSSSELLGTIFIYTDYTLPVETVRNKFFEYLKQSTLWDNKVGTFQVTDLKETTMEIRALVSAVNSSTLWNLRCEIREKLIDYIVQHHPTCLAKARTEKI